MTTGSARRHQTEDHLPHISVCIWRGDGTIESHTVVRELLCAVRTQRKIGKVHKDHTGLSPEIRGIRSRYTDQLARYLKIGELPSKQTLTRTIHDGRLRPTLFLQQVLDLLSLKRPNHFTDDHFRPNISVFARHLRAEAGGGVALGEVGAVHPRLRSEDIVVGGAATEGRGKVIEQVRRALEVCGLRKNSTTPISNPATNYWRPWDQLKAGQSYSEVEARKKGEVSRKALAVAAARASRERPRKCIANENRPLV